MESEPLRWLVLDKTEASCCLDLSLGYLWRAILAILRWNYERKKKHRKSDLGTKGQTCNTGILISVHEETRTKVSQIASQAQNATHWSAILAFKRETPVERKVKLRWKSKKMPKKNNDPSPTWMHQMVLEIFRFKVRNLGRMDIAIL